MAKWIASLFVVAFILVLLPTVSAVTNISSCPYTISSPGEYHIINDIAYGAGTYGCVRITVDDVILDGLGHRISDTRNLASGKWISSCNGTHYVSLDNITIRNTTFRKTVSKDTQGIYLKTYLSNSVFEDLLFENNSGMYYDYIFNLQTCENISFNNITVQPSGTALDRLSVFTCTCIGCNITNSDIRFNSTGTLSHIMASSWNGAYITNNTFISTSVLFYDITFWNSIIYNNTFRKTSTIGDYFHRMTNNLNTTWEKNQFYSADTADVEYFDFSGNNQNDSRFYDNFFDLSSGQNVSIWQYNNNNSFNVTSQSGTNIINGNKIGGNFYATNTSLGHSQTCPNTDDEFCDTIYNESTGWVDYLPLSSYGREVNYYYESDVLEMTNQDFVLHYDYLSDYINGANVTYGCDSTNYSTTESNFNFSGSHRLCNISESYNRTRNITWYTNFTNNTLDQSAWWYSYAGAIDPLLQNQTIYRARVDNTSDVCSTSTIRFYCFDENGTAIDCDLDIRFTSWAPENYGNTSYDRSDQYTPTGANNYWYRKCPGDVSDFWDDINIYYSATGYPQRYQVYENITLNSTLKNYNLYLLPAADGIYVTFQVIAPNYQPLQGVFVNASREISGVDTLVGTGYTDNAGLLTFWLNPDYPHTFYFVAEGYDIFTTTISPTQSAYTVQLGGANATINITEPSLGINWTITPDLYTLDKNTTYNFSFSIDSVYYPLSEWGFNITNGTVNYCQNTSSAPGGGSLYCLMNTYENSTIYMNWYFHNGSEISGSAHWWIADTYEGNYSIAVLFRDIRNFSEAGFNDFTRMIMAFFCIIIIIGLLSWTSGIYSPAAIGAELVFLVWFFWYVGMIPPIYTPTGQAISYAIPLLLSVLYLAYLIWEFR